MQRQKNVAITRIAVLISSGLLAAGMLTSCTAESPEVETTPSATEAPSATNPTPADEPVVFATEVEKFRTDWNVNIDGFASLYNLQQEVSETVPIGHPDVKALQRQLSDEFFANNAVPGNVPRPTNMHSTTEEIFAWTNATSEMYRQYYSDVVREQRIRSINESGGGADEQSATDIEARMGIELMLFNGLDDALSIRGAAFFPHIMNMEGRFDAELPEVTREFIRAEDTGPDGQEWTGRTIWSTVTVDGKPIEVVSRYDWNAVSGSWELTGENSADGSIVQELY